MGIATGIVHPPVGSKPCPVDRVRRVAERHRHLRKPSRRNDDEPDWAYRQGLCKKWPRGKTPRGPQATRHRARHGEVDGDFASVAGAAAAV